MLILSARGGAAWLRLIAGAAMLAGAIVMLASAGAAQAENMSYPSSYHHHGAHDFSLLTYNVFARPLVVHDGQLERLLRIPRAIVRRADSRKDPIDAILFQEAFLSGTRTHNRFVAGLRRRGFSYITRVFGGSADLSFKFIDSGLFVASRWPITKQRGHVFSACDGFDCLAQKGVLYVRIVKTVDGVTQTYHLLTTHMQSSDTAAARAIRARQAAEIKKFINTLAIPRRQAVIIAGDLNVDRLHHPSEFRRLLRRLKAVSPASTNAVVPTFNSRSNVLVGSDSTARAGGCEDSYNKTMHCKCCRRQLLDYLLYLRTHRKPRSASQTTIRLKTTRRYSVCMSAPMQPYYVSGASAGCLRTWRIRDLSDHYPVLARFRF